MFAYPNLVLTYYLNYHQYYPIHAPLAITLTIAVPVEEAD
jgi:hypothetical protein